MSCRRSLICFNSMKVRLKLEKSENEARGSAFQFHEGPIKTFDFEVREHGLIMFQFHEGPIKTYYDYKTNYDIVRFNSMKVRLKPRAYLHEIASECVSIP